mmetsp:Transcript_3738/g.7288  ORF Transcript_3738/g.7288 Transcript_3738/m.7288 type:complete len:172 (+) Transcript_3738:84-599(+)
MLTQLTRSASSEDLPGGRLARKRDESIRRLLGSALRREVENVDTSSMSENGAPFKTLVIKTAEVFTEPEAASPAEERRNATLDCEFLTGGNLKRIVFTKLPIGMGFANKMPLVISTVVLGGHAEEMGVQVGWQFKSINGTELENLEFKKAMQVFKDGALRLPKHGQSDEKS